MLYTDLDKISLDTFIDVFTGDKSKLIIEGEHSEKRTVRTIGEAHYRICRDNRRSLFSV